MLVNFSQMGIIGLHFLTWITMKLVQIGQQRAHKRTHATQLFFQCRLP